MHSLRFILVPATVLALSGVSPGGPAPAPGEKAPAPATAPAGGPVAAYANGVPVPIAKLNDLLIRARGLEILRHLVADELVRQEAGRNKVEVTEADVQGEHDRTLDRMFGSAAGAGKTPAQIAAAAKQREALLDQLLTQRKVSRVRWQLTMRRSAVLRRLAERDVTVTDKEVRDEFDFQFAPKVVVRHIQTASLRDTEKILKLLAQKKDFAELAGKHSTNASTRNAPLPPIGRKPGNPPLPEAIRQAALALKKVGDVSEPIQTGTAFHLVKLDKILEPDDVKFEDVRDKLREAIRERNLLLAQQQILQRLIREANIEYVDPVLKEQAERESKP